jgi:hypothetical protein
MKAHGEKWKARKSKIDAEYDAVMKSTTEALSTGDAALLAFMVNPVGFLSLKGAKAGVKATGGAAQFLEDAGISLPLAGLVGMTDKLTKPEDPEERGVIGGAIHGLAKLFFIAHHAPEGNVLAEAEEEEKEEKEKPTGDLESGLRELFEETGLLSKIETDAKELVAAKIEVVDTVMDDLRGRFEALSPLYKATTAEEFVKAIEAANSGGHDIGGGGLGALGAELKKSVDSMIANPESKETLVAAVLKSQGKKMPKPDSGEEVPEVEEEALRKEAEQIVFMQSKQDTQDKIFNGVSDMKKVALETIQEDLPPEGDWEAMTATPTGEALVDKVKGAIAEIKSA